MTFKAILCAVAAIVGVAVSNASQAQQSPLKAGVNPAGAPMSFQDANSGAFRGVSVELVEEIARDAGFQIQFVPMGLAELIPALNANKIDIIVANMLATPERKASIDFSETYHSGGDALIVAKTDTREYTSLADLKGMSIGAQKGSAQLNALQASGLFADIRLYDTVVAVMREVSAGRIAAGIVGGTTARYEMHQGRFHDLRLVATYRPAMVSGIGFGMRKNEPDLLQRINLSLASRWHPQKYPGSIRPLGPPGRNRTNRLLPTKPTN